MKGFLQNNSGKKQMAILGPLGTFTEEAAVKYCDEKKIDCSLVPYRTVSEVFVAVEKGEVSNGVVPIENFLNGHVMETLDNLYRSNLKIEKAIVLPVEQCFAACFGFENIDTIKSHSQALAQCSEYLDKNYPDAVRIDSLSTASAMKEISEMKLDNVAVIGSKIGAERYGLNILEENIGNCGDNKTMFIVIGKGNFEKSIRNRTSIVIVPSANKPGVLMGIINSFASENIDLKMIQSRPDGKGNYIFYLDIVGYIEDENVARVLGKLRTDSIVKVLGSYPYVSLSGV